MGLAQPSSSSLCSFGATPAAYQFSSQPPADVGGFISQSSDNLAPPMIIPNNPFGAGVGRSAAGFSMGSTGGGSHSELPRRRKIKAKRLARK